MAIEKNGDAPKISLEEQAMLVTALDARMAQIQRAQNAETDGEVKMIRQKQLEKFAALKNRVMSKEFL